MLLFGRLSTTIVWPPMNWAGALPVFRTVTVQVQGLPTVVEPPTSLVLLIWRSGAVTSTSSVHELFASTLSAITPLGSTVQTPPPRGLAYSPVALGVAVMLTVNVPFIGPS